MAEHCIVLMSDLQAVCEPAAGMCYFAHTNRCRALQANTLFCLLHARGGQCTSDTADSEQLSFSKLVLLHYLGVHRRVVCSYGFVDHALPERSSLRDLVTFTSAFCLQVRFDVYGPWIKSQAW